MKLGTRNILLGIYDMLVAIGAIAIGIMMIGANYGIFIEYPEEWLGRFFFKSWIPIGMIAITVFGVGNFLAAITGFVKRRNPWMSILMGVMLITCVIAQIAMVGWYLASFEIMLVGVVQLLLCAMVIVGMMKEKAILTDTQNLTDEVTEVEDVSTPTEEPTPEPKEEVSD
jgi:hypothetical protein